MYAAIVFVVIIIYLTFLCYRSLFHASRKEKKSLLPTNWPIFGMLPGVLLNIGRFHEYITEILRQSGGTFYVKGPWFTNISVMFTCDPVNVHYIQTKNSSNFHKGPIFKKIFDIMGEGLLTAELESWENQRRTAKSLINKMSFLDFVATTISNKAETALIPILETAAETGSEVDVQQLFERLTFDSSCALVLGHDPASLCRELPHLPHEKAFVDAEEAIFYRHIFPEISWKLQDWLHIGKENKLRKAKEIIPRFISNCISAKHQKSNYLMDQKHGNGDFDMLASYNRAVAEKGSLVPNIPEKVWKDTLLNFMFAGNGTISAALTWFIWLVATNPAEEEKIRQEIITTNLQSNKHVGSKWELADLKKLNYLHGAVCETLRLFPPVPFQLKTTVAHDILPSGHRINPNTKTVLSLYSMGRMESLWGKDCLEFKPGRWISETGCIKTEPSFKFSAFSAGPRSCVGKEITFIEMKIVAAAIMSRFKFQVAQGHPVSPSTSVVLLMKHGLKVKVSDCV